MLEIALLVLVSRGTSRKAYGKKIALRLLGRFGFRSLVIITVDAVRRVVVKVEGNDFFIETAKSNEFCTQVIEIIFDKTCRV